MAHWRPQPRLRQKQKVDVDLTDREIFQSLELGDDMWEDAHLISAYRYLRHYHKVQVPVSWQAVLEQLDADLEKLCPSK